MSDPFLDGMVAHDRGLTIEDNEYQDAGDALLWREGFEEGVRLREEDLRRARAKAVQALPALGKLAAMTPEQVAVAIGMPLAAWPGRCYEVACRLNQHLGLKLTPCYGHWLGPIREGSLFADRRGLGFCQHGWLAGPDGQVVDPTRYVFEGREPYIFIADQDGDGCYDRGGNQVRRMLADARPRPAWDAAGAAYRLAPARQPLHDWVFGQLEASEARPAGAIAPAELFWLCNGDLARLGPMAADLYRFADEVGCRGFVPVDNWQAAMQAAEDCSPPARERAAG